MFVLAVCLCVDKVEDPVSVKDETEAQERINGSEAAEILVGGEW